MGMWLNAPRLWFPRKPQGYKGLVYRGHSSSRPASPVHRSQVCAPGTLGFAVAMLLAARRGWGVPAMRLGFDGLTLELQGVFKMEKKGRPFLGHPDLGTSQRGRAPIQHLPMEIQAPYLGVLDTFSGLGPWGLLLGTQRKLRFHGDQGIVHTHTWPPRPLP